MGYPTMWKVGKDLQEVPLQGAGEELTSKAQALPALLITCIISLCQII